jgi:hypothetical protein
MPRAGAHALLTRPPLGATPKDDAPFDLHVLGAPPAFVLSQDQTLSFIPFSRPERAPKPCHRRPLQNAAAKLRKPAPAGGPFRHHMANPRGQRPAGPSPRRAKRPPRLKGNDEPSGHPPPGDPHGSRRARPGKSRRPESSRHLRMHRDQRPPGTSHQDTPQGPPPTHPFLPLYSVKQRRFEDDPATRLPSAGPAI